MSTGRKSHWAREFAIHTKKGTYIGKWESVKVTTEFLNISVKGLSAVLTKSTKSTNGYTAVFTGQ